MNEPSVFDGPEITMPPTLLHHDAEGRAYEHRELHNMYAARASASAPYPQPPVSRHHTVSSPQPTAYSLQPTASSLQPTAYCLLPTAYSLQPTASSLQPPASSPQPTAPSLQPPAPQQKASALTPPSGTAFS